MNSPVISHPFITNPFSKKMLDLFDFLRRKKVEYGVASCMLLTGESGSGKSGLAKQYAKNHPIQELPERTYIPVLHFELTSVSTPEEFLRGLLVAIHDPQQGHGARNKKELLDRLVRLIQVTGVELLILDELQVIIERRSAKVITGIADLFKDLIKDAKVPIVFMGMPWTRYLIDSNPQLKRRIQYRHNIPPYRISTEADKKDYSRLLKLLGSHYGLSSKIKLQSEEMTFRLFSVTSGNLRDTINLVCDAYISAQVNQAKVNITLFAEVLRTYGVLDEFNAFLIPINKLEIRELIKSSDFDFGSRANRNAIIESEYAVFSITEEKGVYCLSGAA